MIASPAMAGEPHMIDFVELASLGWKWYSHVFVILINHVGFIFEIFEFLSVETD